MNEWTLKTIVTAICIIAGFCLVAASSATTPTTGATREALQAEYKQHSARWQDLTKKKAELTGKYQQAYGSLTLEQEKEAAEAGRVQEALRLIEKADTGGAKKPKARQ